MSAIWKKNINNKNKDELAVSNYNIRRYLRWNKFIHKTLKTISEEPIEMELCDWVCALLYDGIFPELSEKGYNLGVSSREVANDFMNYLFNFETAWNSGQICRFIGQFAYNNYHNLTLEDEEFFFKRFDTEFWKNMKSYFEIEQFSDESDFANALWEKIPVIIFEMINKNTSNAVFEMEEFLSCIDNNDSSYVYNEETSTVVVKSREIDPYIQDYWAK
jgi:hypothetical protein